MAKYFNNWYVTQIKAYNEKHGTKIEFTKVPFYFKDASPLVALSLFVSMICCICGLDGTDTYCCSCGQGFHHKCVQNYNKKKHQYVTCSRCNGLFI